MCVDDEPHVLLALSKLLERSGFRVETAPNGPEGLKKLEGIEPQVVVSDYRMGEMDGVSFLQHVKKQYPGIQRIMLTGYAEMDVVEKAINQGEVHHFLTKPWDNEQLVELIRSAIDRRTLMAENERLQELTREQNKQLKELAEGLEAKIEQRTELVIRAKRAWEETFDSIVDPLSIVGDDYRIFRGNIAWADTAGKDVREIPGESYGLIFGQDGTFEGCPVQETLRTGNKSSAEVRSVNGDTVYLLWTFPMANTIAGEKRVVCHYKDVTEEKAIERHLMQNEKLAAVGQLAGGVAHEINNPLSAIISFTQLGLRDVEAGSELEEFLKEIEESALRCKEIVQNLLIFSRAPQQGEISEVDVNTVVERAVVLVAHLFNKGSVSLEVKNDGTLPKVRANANRLMQVLVNLLTNARHALEDKGGNVVVETAVHSNDMVMFRVQDDGMGIPEDVLPKIFEPFFTTKEEGKGTGLGLSLSYGIVQEHGGLFEVDSAPGEGTEFRVLLPPIAT